MFAEPVSDGVAEGVEAGEVDLVALPQAPASSVRHATATMYRVLPETFKMQLTLVRRRPASACTHEGDPIRARQLGGGVFNPATL
jgi:hypothetical protein